MNNLMKEALHILEVKGKEALELAKRQIMLYKIEDKRLCQALEYYAKHWNDTLHPGIISLVCETVGGDAKKSLYIQVPMLFLTAAIDIHDDILDESRIKNGRLTIFGKYGKDIALLVGDGMMLRGVVMLQESAKKFQPQIASRIISAVEAAFIRAGDAHALEADFKRKMNMNPKLYFYALKKKASILEAHALIGALIGGAGENDVKALGKYGRILGTLILLRDEFIDILEIQELNERIKNKCLPLPLLYALQNPKSRKKIMKILSKPKIVEDDLDLIVDYILEEKRVKLLKVQMEKLIETALQIISDIPNNDNLELIVKATIEDI